MSTSMHINYHSDIEGTFVEYTVASDTEYLNKKQVIGQCDLWSRPEEEGSWKSSGFTERNVCRVELVDLKPDTLYRYRVGKNNFSEDFLFRTAGQDSFSFVHLTDPQFTTKADSEVFNNLLTKALEINPSISFGLFSGDAVDKGGRDDLWKMFFEASNIRNLPFAMTTGNHEYYDTGTNMTNNDYFTAHYFNPQNGPEKLLGSTYYYKYNNVLFVVIDTEVQTAVPQVQWFKDVVAKEQAQYIIVSMHRSFYGSKYASHSFTVRNTWQKTFEQCGVDLVLSGHDHVYARSKLLYQNEETEDIYKGTTYIIGGSAGRKFYSLDRTPSGNFKYYAKAIEDTSVANIFTVDDEKITMNLIDLNGNTLDSHTIYAKRPKSIKEEFSKKDFLDNIEIIHSAEDLNRLTVKWPSAYGHVLNVNVSDGRYTYETFLATEQVTDQSVILSVGKVYNMQVIVRFNDGTEETIDFEISTKMPYGTIENFKAAKIKKSSVQLSWEAELLNKQIKHYAIYVNNELLEEVNSELINYTIKGLTKDTLYEVTLKAVDIYGDVVYEDKIEFTTLSQGCSSKTASLFIFPLVGLLFIRRRRYLI